MKRTIWRDLMNELGRLKKLCFGLTGSRLSYFHSSTIGLDRQIHHEKAARPHIDFGETTRTTREGSASAEHLRHQRHVHFEISLRPWRKTPRNSDRNLGDLTSRKKLKGQSKSLDGQRTKTPLLALKNHLTFVTIITNV